jgi:anthranilate/para-aminobenzoate synthase component I
MTHVQSQSQNCPVIEELTSCLDAPSCYAAVKDRPWSFFLDSGMNHHGLGWYSFIGCDPFLVLHSRGEDIQLLSKDGRRSIRGDPFDVLQGLLKRYAVALAPSPVPFAGGAPVGAGMPGKDNREAGEYLLKTCLGGSSLTIIMLPCYHS